MKVGILQPGYIPWLGFFEQVYRSNKFVLYDDVQFDKNSWRNRNRIKTPDGPLWLTIPVRQKGHISQTLLETEIAEKKRWPRKHLNSLKSCYAKAPYFDRYIDDLSEILQQEWTCLVDLDIALIKYLLRELEITTPLIRSSELGISGKKTERLISICKALEATTFYEGAAGRNYMEEKKFEEAGIRLEYQDYHHPTYPQLYGDFIPYLSVIDLLFNCGDESLEIIIGE
ncbi:MAG: WbqC family protein [Deltaproteobacteria bacterium]|nr:WbqC family protein [Deltaproteobacteria bacterium]